MCLRFIFIETFCVCGNALWVYSDSINVVFFFKSMKIHLNLIEAASFLCRAISREAARKRRRVESDVFRDLSHLLPLQPSVRAHLDKPSVIRLTLSYIRTHALFKGTGGHHADIASACYAFLFLCKWNWSWVSVDTVRAPEADLMILSTMQTEMKYVRRQVS